MVFDRYVWAAHYLHQGPPAPDPAASAAQLSKFSHSGPRGAPWTCPLGALGRHTRADARGRFPAQLLPPPRQSCFPSTRVPEGAPAAAQPGHTEPGPGAPADGAEPSSQPGGSQARVPGAHRHERGLRATVGHWGCGCSSCDNSCRMCTLNFSTLKKALSF